jgi:hypothetical protein
LQIVAALLCACGPKTISVFPTGANGNIGNTGPGWGLGSELRLSLR